MPNIHSYAGRYPVWTVLRHLAEHNSPNPIHQQWIWRNTLKKMLQTVQASVLSFQLKWNDKQTDPKPEDLQVSDSYERVPSAWVWFWKRSRATAKPSLRRAINNQFIDMLMSFS